MVLVAWLHSREPEARVVLGIIDVMAAQDDIDCSVEKPAEKLDYAARPIASTRLGSRYAEYLAIVPFAEPGPRLIAQKSAGLFGVWLPAAGEGAQRAVPSLSRGRPCGTRLVPGERRIEPY